MMTMWARNSYRQDVRLVTAVNVKLGDVLVSVPFSVQSTKVKHALGDALTVTSDPQFTAPPPLVLPPPDGAELVAIVNTHGPRPRSVISPPPLGVPQPVQRS